MNRTTKVIFFAVLIIAILIVIYSLFPIGDIISKSKFFNKDTEAIAAIDSTAFIQDSTFAENEETYNEVEDENESESSFSLSHLWSDPSNDEENVNEALKFFAYMTSLDSQNTHLGEVRWQFSSFENDLDSYESDESKNFIKQNYVKIRKELNRKPEKIKAAFNNYKYLFYQLFSQKLYRKANIDKYIEILTLSYNDIQNKENPDKALNDIYDIMLKRDGEDAFDIYDSIEPFISGKSYNFFNSCFYQDGNKMQKGDVVWAYSFWARRAKENNLEEVFNILKEIEQYYDSN